MELKSVEEVWWATTKEYTVEMDNGEIVKVRWAENPKLSEFFILKDDGWEGWGEDEEYPELYNAMMEGELD